MSDRTRFLDKNRVYVSAGVMFYTIHPQTQVCYFMMQKCTRGTWKLEDFGGKSSVDDTSIKDVAFRECQEELNYKGGIDYEFLQKQLEDSRSITHRTPKNKYLMYLIYMPYEFKTKLNMEEFGDYEELDKIKRQVLWISYKDFMELPMQDIHPRFNPDDDFRNKMPIILAGARL